MTTVPKERLGILFTLVGPGGVGKNALLNDVIDLVNGLSQLPTATTRKMRPNEQQGREHLFVSMEEFQWMINRDELLEHQEVHPGKFYGIPRATVDKAIADGRDLIADIEVLGAAIIRNTYPENSVIVFIMPPSIDELHTRLRKRDTKETDLQDRLNRSPMEMLFAPSCKYIIINDDQADAVEQLRHIIRYERSETDQLPLAVANVDYLVRVTGGSGQRVVEVAFDQGDPRALALKVLREQIPQAADVDLQYHSEIEGKLPYKIDFDPQAQTYRVTYFFTYG